MVTVTKFDKLSAFNSSALLDIVKKPSITGSVRLETEPTAINMMVGLQAQVADPLWMLARQWQFNEFQGEDAGTPLNVSFAIEGARVNAFRAGKIDQPFHAMEAAQAPLETLIEAEAVWETHARFRGEAGLQLLRMAPSKLIRDALRDLFALKLELPPDPQADQAGVLWSTLLNKQTVDARSVVSALQPFRDGPNRLTGLPAELEIALAMAQDEVVAARTALEAWLGWLNDVVYEGPSQNHAWQKDRMEYAFALTTGPLGEKISAVELTAEEYTDGHVDWEEFQASAVPGPLEQAEPVAPVANPLFAVQQRHPTPVRYPGMPADRYWEFEDGNVNFAGAEAGITDFLRMSVTEFALTFGNDWFVVPVRLPVGALYQVSRFEVLDSFGELSVSKPVQNINQTPWSMYELSANNNDLKHTMFLPDTLDGVMEGSPLEHTLLVRDEMANIAWAIEKKVQGVSGEPLDRDLEAKGLAFQQQIKFKELPNPQLVYRLATPVPANWIPLLPTRNSKLDPNDPLHIQLERAGMKRFHPTVAALGVPDEAYEKFLVGLDDYPNFIDSLPILNEEANVRAYVFHPRGWLLRNDPNKPMPDNDRLVLEEEEVPRIGASLKRKFQYARSADGRRWLWIGRSKVAGRGEAASNFRFDVAVKTATLR